MSELGFQTVVGGDKCYTVLNQNNAYCYQDTNEFGYISICYQPFISPDWATTAKIQEVVFNAIWDLINPESKKYNESIAEEIAEEQTDYEHTEGKKVYLEKSVFYPHRKSVTNYFYFLLSGKHGGFPVYINHSGQVFIRNYKGVSGCLDVFETIFLN